MSREDKNGQRKHKCKKNAIIHLVALTALPAVGIAAPVGGGGMVAAAAATGVGVAAVPVAVSEVGVLLSLPTVAAFDESPAVLALVPAGAARRWPPAAAGSASAAVPAAVSTTGARPLAAAARPSIALVAGAPGPLPGAVALRSRGGGRRFFLWS